MIHINLIEIVLIVIILAVFASLLHFVISLGKNKHETNIKDDKEKSNVDWKP